MIKQLPNSNLSIHEKIRKLLYIQKFMDTERLFDTVKIRDYLMFTYFISIKYLNCSDSETIINYMYDKSIKYFIVRHGLFIFSNDKRILYKIKLLVNSFTTDNVYHFLIPQSDDVEKEIIFEYLR